MGARWTRVMVACALVAGCGSSDGDGGVPVASGSNAGPGNPSGRVVASGSGAPAIGALAVTGNLTDALTGAPLPAASACLLQSPTTCVHPDAAGDFTLRGLTPTGSGLTIALPDYMTGVWPFSPTANVTGWIMVLRPTARMMHLGQQAGATLAPTTGAITFVARDGNDSALSGVSVTVSPAGRIGYMADGATIDPKLTATTAQGDGFVFDLPAGDVTITFSAAGRKCTRRVPEGWPAAAGATMVVPIQAGALTRASAVCL